MLIAQNKARILQNFEEILDELQLGKEKEKIGSLFCSREIKLSKDFANRFMTRLLLNLKFR